MANPVSNAIGLSGDPRVDGLLQGAAWQFSGGTRTLTYSFSLNDSPSGGAWSEGFKAAIVDAFTDWSNVANIRFVEQGSGTVFTQSTADVAITLTGNELSQVGAVALALFPSPDFAADFLADSGYTRANYGRPEGDIFLDNYAEEFNSASAVRNLDYGRIGYSILLHEIGHALGLKHTSDDGGNGRPTFAQLGIAGSDGTRFTVMTELALDPPDFVPGQAYYPATPMPLDILAIQTIYGANMSYRSGNDLYDFSAPWTSGVDTSAYQLVTMWDAGGIDTWDVSSINSQIDLRPGHYSTVGLATVAIAYGTTIERVIGGPLSETMIGNDAANYFDTGVNWTGTEPDRLSGGKGNDTYEVRTNTVVTENAGEGTDTVISWLDAYTLAANVENLTIAANRRAEGHGNALDNTLVGNQFWNKLFGGAGNDFIDGRGGVDVMTGGPGNDTYVVEDFDYTRAPTVISVQGPNVGPNDVDWVTPNDAPFNVVLSDRDRNGTLDELRVYAYTPTTTWDLTIVAPQGQTLGSGIYFNATERSFGPSSGPAHYYFWNLGGWTDGGTISIYSLEYVTVNAGFQLQQFSADLDLWSDTATYRVTFNYRYPGGFVASEKVVEAPNEGSDTVRSGIDYTLPANVENLELTGSGALSGTGNALRNTIIGNAAGNVLDGGAGDDTLHGGMGDDRLIWSGGLDAFDGGAHTDIADFSAFASAVLVSLSASEYEAWTRDRATLADGTWRPLVDMVNVESIVGTSHDDMLNGNALANRLEGGAGNDRLYASEGPDTLDGGIGVDTADFSTLGAAVLVSLNASEFEAWTRGGPTIAAGVWRPLADLINVENLVGTAYADALYGNHVSNVLGYTGGLDILDGGAGTDTADFSMFDAAVLISLNASEHEVWTRDRTTLSEGPWRPAADVSAIESFVGTMHADELYGNSAANRFAGGAGDDLLAGRGGADHLTGGPGIDRFDYDALVDGSDVIADFSLGPAGDRLDIRDLLAGYRPGTSNIDSFVRLDTSGGDTVVSVNADGVGTDFAVVATLQAVSMNANLLNDMLAQGNLIVA